MARSLDLVGAFHAPAKLINKQLDKAFSGIPEEKLDIATLSFPAKSIDGNKGELETKLSLGQLKAQRLALQTLKQKQKAFLLPRDLYSGMIQKTRIVQILETADEKYVPEPKAWQKLIDRRKSIPSLAYEPIKQLNVKDAFPNGIIKSYGTVGKNMDYIEIKLPPSPIKTRKMMDACYRSIPENFGGTWLTIADVRCLGVTVHMVKRTPPPKPKIAKRMTPVPRAVPKPRPISLPRSKDPGLVYLFGAYVLVFPQTFYHLSEMSKGFLSLVRKQAEKWDVESFVQSYSN